MKDRRLRILAAAGLAVGGVLGLVGTLAPSAAFRGLAWGVDGMALVMAAALLTVDFHRRAQDVVAAGFLVFAVGESLVLSGAALDLERSTPAFGAGVGLWAVALALVSAPHVFPAAVRALGVLAALLFLMTALQIFAGAGLDPLSSPLPFYGYPVLVATLGGWIWTLLRP